MEQSVDEAIVDFSPGVKYLDITDDVADAVAGAIPLRALCRPECLGRCPACAADLNCSPCSCAADARVGGCDGGVVAEAGAGASSVARAGLAGFSGGGAGGGEGGGVGGGLGAGALADLMRLKRELEASEEKNTRSSHEP